MADTSELLRLCEDALNDYTTTHAYKLARALKSRLQAEATEDAAYQRMADERAAAAEYRAEMRRE